MKTHYLLLLALSLAVALGSCSDSDDDIVTPEEKGEDKYLVCNTNSILALKTLSGSPDGGVENMDEDKFTVALAQTLSYSIRKLRENSSLKFIGDTDSLIVSGYLYHDGNSTYSVDAMKMPYKFEDGKLMIWSTWTSLPERWLTFGYGNKDRIDVYIDMKTVYDNGERDDVPWFGNGYSETPITTLRAPISQGEIDGMNWDTFFDYASQWWLEWNYHYYYRNIKNRGDLKYRSLAASWSIHKFSYLPQETE